MFGPPLPKLLPKPLSSGKPPPWNMCIICRISVISGPPDACREAEPGSPAPGGAMSCIISIMLMADRIISTVSACPPR